MITIDNIKPTGASTLLICISSFFCVELMIFLLNKSLFLNLDLIRLSSIGIGITTPLLICNTVITSNGETSKVENSNLNEKEEKEKAGWAVSGAMTILLVSFTSLISYTYKFSLYKNLWILFWVELSILLLTAFSTKRNKRRR